MRLRLLKIKFFILHKLKGLTRVFTDLRGARKTATILGAAIFVPAFLAVFLFYGAPSLKSITGALNFAPDKANTQQRGDATKDSGLQLISYEQFIKKHKPSPAVLPQPVRVNASLSGFIKSNSTNELLPARNWSVPFTDINSTVAVAVSVPGNRVLYGKNITSVRPIASLSKLMTALVAVEHMDLNEQVTISHRAIAVEGNSAGLVAGEKLTVQQLLYALMLESSNDAAAALQEHYNNNKPDEDPDFMTLMNEIAKEMNLTDTHFSEPSGLSASNVSSAQSVARMLWAAYQNEDLREIMAAPTYTTEAADSEVIHYWVNLNTLLGTSDSILAGKTGFTNEAGPSMAVIASTGHPEQKVIVVVMDADDRVEASRNLLDWVQRAYFWKD